MSKNKNIFDRSTLSNIKGFKDLNLFDDFIQSALDKYNYTSELPKLDETAEKFHDFILDDTSQIPDLIIYNQIFNKNKCFAGYYNSYGFNKFPRKQFVLKAEEKKENNEHKENNNINDDKEIENKDKEQIKDVNNNNKGINNDIIEDKKIEENIDNNNNTNTNIDKKDENENNNEEIHELKKEKKKEKKT